MLNKYSMKKNWRKEKGILVMNFLPSKLIPLEN